MARPSRAVVEAAHIGANDNAASERWFPTGYGRQGQARHRFPAIEALRGVPGSPLQLTSKYVDIGATLSG